MWFFKKKSQPDTEIRCIAKSILNDIDRLLWKESDVNYDGEEVSGGIEKYRVFRMHTFQHPELNYRVVMTIGAESGEVFSVSIIGAHYKFNEREQSLIGKKLLDVLAQVRALKELRLQREDEEKLKALFPKCYV